MIKLNKHGLISKRLIASEFTVGNTFVEGGGTPEELAVLSLTNEQLAALSYIVNGEGRIIPVGEDGTFDTKIGHSYCIRHTDDLTLHEAWLSNDENLYVKRYGSGQLLFFATSEKCKINDPSYIVTEVFRMAALNDFVDWSGISTTQAWFKEIEVELTELLGSSDKFVLEIADENMLVVHTDRVDDVMLATVKATTESAAPAGTEVVQYNHHIEVSWRDINKYAACTNEDDMYEVNPSGFVLEDVYGTPRPFVNDLTSEGDFVYPLPNFTRLYNAHHVKGGFFKRVYAKHFRISLPKCTTIYALFGGGTKTETLVVDAPLADGYQPCAFSNMSALRQVEFNGRFGNATSVFQNCPLLEWVNADFSSATAMDYAFDQCAIPKDLVLKVCAELPVMNAKITLGIHVDYQNDDEVLTAIANAESKGWTLTVQWNGTASSAASTMATGSLIYAKVGEHELLDGTTEQVLDWGHYVTDETGYETFRSLESAYKYFGLEIPEKE